MQLGTWNSELGTLEVPPSTCHLAPGTKIILALSLLFPFLTGCLFLRPYTPSARLCDSGLYYDTAIGYENYSDYWAISKENPINENDMHNLDLNAGVRTRIPSTNLELAADFRGVYYNLNVKYGLIQDKDKYPILLAIDSDVYLYANQTFSFGGAVGPDLNIVLIDKYPLDLVLAAYYQYFNYDKPFTDFNMGTRDHTPSPNSLYFYAGFEFPFFNGSRASFGCSYDYYINSYYQYKPFYLSFSVRYPSRPSAKTQEEIQREKEQEPGADYYYNKAQDLIRNHNYHDAAALLAKALEIFPDDSKLNNTAGLCYYKTGDLGLSYFYYYKALELNPGDTALKKLLKKIELEMRNEKK